MSNPLRSRQQSAVTENACWKLRYAALDLWQRVCYMCS